MLPVTEEHNSHFTFLKVQSEAHQAAGEFNHFIQLRGAESFHFGDTVTSFTDDTDVGLLNGRFDVRDLGFQFLENAAHDFKGLESG